MQTCSIPPTPITQSRGCNGLREVSPPRYADNPFPGTDVCLVSLSFTPPRYADDHGWVLLVPVAEPVSIPPRYADNKVGVYWLSCMQVSPPRYADNSDDAAVTLPSACFNSS